MERLTNAEIEAIRKRAEKATEGSWKVYDEYCDTVEREEDGECIARIASRDKRNDDMEFIAHARTDIPKLLAEIDRLRGQLRELICAVYEYEPEGTALMDLAERIDSE